MQNKTYQIRPYARLITMLGEQLIKNEVIALSELIKNSYDADASWVKVSFCDFNDDYSINDNSKIIIQDNGVGMNQEIIEKSWLNPATPTKLKQKQNQKGKTQKGRILQGEKGIGRFAIFKLGSTIKITTKTEKDNYENQVLYDFSKYDNDFTQENGIEKELYIDDLEVQYAQNGIVNFTNNNKIEFGINNLSADNHGTIIEISNLKSNWTKTKINNVKTEIGKMLPIFKPKGNVDFDVKIYLNNEIFIEGDYLERLNGLLENKPVFKITEGYYSEKDKIISYLINGSKQILELNNSEVKVILKYLQERTSNEYKTECGDFRFEFYVFDFNAKEDTKYYLSKEMKSDIKKHRIYLYRDDVRVLPYGDPDDDWLGIDMIRGTVSAAEFLSNDQVVGCVYISQERNPNLKDKTNREGLIDEGTALRDFTSILRVILAYIRKYDYAKYAIENKRKEENKLIQEERPEIFFQKLEETFKDDANAIKIINDCSNAYKKEKQILNRRIEQVEDLAAVGLSVETASHDIMMILNLVYNKLSDTYKDLQKGNSPDLNTLKNIFSELITNVSFIKDSMKDVQILFPSTKHRAKTVNVKDILDKVHQIYKNTLNENNIFVNIYTSSDSSLEAKTRDAVLFQTFINLFDNAIYWLKTVDEVRKIEIEIDGNNQKLVFSDSGPGIREDIKNYIFEPFFSGKGEDGRGLGLYIAKQLLDRYDYNIDLADAERDKHLKGANFVLDFSKKE